ncbi:serine/threonine-protein phosphatase rdgC isoform X2 [Neocloeon triangulifer]|uniref:serine/threonine-protein phosphatase rdgC isoform X2 n=1 Tax=Neocloeon triangulifer TaxID=2078957 RepID=UPI00286F7611|nr:serine/threonine-protein phosphatase rdgC isoform X2 [Neocloeon triangulifer]
MHCVCAQQEEADGGTGGGIWDLLRCRRMRKGHKFTMPKGERSMKAAILIQKWYRRYLARMEVRRRYTWTIFQSLEYAGEQDEVQLYNFFSTLLAKAPTPTGPLSATDPGPPPDSDDSEDANFGPVEPGYKGPRVDFPLTKQGLDTLLTAFRHKKPPRVHAHYAWHILREATTILRRLPNLNQASTTVGKQITICGDLHGKLQDLLVILHKNGLPCAENPYVFNGDFVDRGKRSMEVLLLLCALVIVFPGAVFLNRGNHEDRAINVRYGFIREVRTKYKMQSERLLRQIERLYRALPLGSVVDGQVLVVHGGISNKTDLREIWTLDRFKFASLMDPPQSLKENGEEDEETPEKRAWRQVFDVLWSDPQAAEGCSPNTLRGAGTYFGPDVTDEFLTRHNLRLLVRSHECKLEGYELAHNNKCITIFSASDYYEVGSNKGAYVKLSGNPLTPQFVQFQVSAAKSSKQRRLTFRQRVGLVEQSALKSLAATIEARRICLEAEFKNKDPDGKGTIPVKEWCEAMQQGTGLSVPWRLLRDRVLSPQAAEEAARTGMIKYSETFSGPGSSGCYVTEALYRDKMALESLFSALDTDHSGTISMTELKQACSLLPNDGSEPGQLCARLARCLDFNQDGRVDLNEFLEAFRLVDAGRTPAEANESPDEED